MNNLIIFLVIAFISWIINLVSKNNDEAKAGGGRAPRPEPPRDGRLQNEIDIFLQEVSGQKKGNARVEEDIPMEIVEVEETPPRRRNVRQQPPRRPSRRQEARETSASEHNRPGPGVAERQKPGSANLGGGVRQHVSEHLSSGDVESHVEEHLAHDVDQSVQQHLGQFSVGESVDLGAPGTHPLVSLLRSPSGMRQAILMGEILSPPKSQRK